MGTYTAQEVILEVELDITLLFHGSEHLYRLVSSRRPASKLRTKPTHLDGFCGDLYITLALEHWSSGCGAIAGTTHLGTAMVSTKDDNVVCRHCERYSGYRFWMRNRKPETRERALS